MAEPIDIWDIPLNPTMKQRQDLQKQYGFWYLGTILVVREFLEKHCLGLKPAPSPALLQDSANMTIEELRSRAVDYCREADRLIALTERKTLFSLRTPTDKEPKFIDNTEEAVRFWALQNPHEDGFLYKEVWAKDGERWHILEREVIDNPVQTAKTNTRS